MKKIIYILAAIAPVLTVVIMFKSYNLEERKIREGNIPKKSIEINTYGGTNLTKTLINLEDAEVSINVSGKEIKNVYVINYDIKNTGDAPILKNDFSEWLTLKFSERWQVLVVKSSYSMPSSLRPEWKRTNQHEVQLKPLLINSKDTFGVKVYLTDTKNEDVDELKVNEVLRGTWSVRIPNLDKIDIDDPIRRAAKYKKTDNGKWPRSFKLLEVALGKSAFYATLWRAGFFFSSAKWGVYAIISLAAIMIYVFLYLLYPLQVKLNVNTQFLILCIALISIFSFAAAESYITFFVLLGQNVYWVNYLFMSLYLVSIIYLFVKHNSWE